MNASAHLAVGAAAGLAAQSFLPSGAGGPERLFCAVAAGFMAHIVLDIVPHKEYVIEGLNLWSVLFAETAAVFFLVLSSQNSPLLNLLIFFGMSGGAVPDLIRMSSEHFGWNWFRVLNMVISQFHFKGESYLGFRFDFLDQSIVAMFAVIFVKSRPAL